MTAVWFRRSAVIDRRYRNLAVRILGRKETALLRGHVAPDVIERIARDLFEERFASDLERIEIRGGELGLIVEHFFEMRDVPVGIDGIAVEPAAQMIMHSAGRHLAQSEKIHLQ